MKLAEMTWPEVDGLDRNVVVVIPTGSLEQHGPHLPLFTDSILATAVAEAVEKRIPSEILLTPTIWLGASAHHLPFAGSLSASFKGYQEVLLNVAESLIAHDFKKFYFLNGHGGNQEPNGIVCRILKQKYPELVIGHHGYYQPIAEEVADVLEGKHKSIIHACEAETSLIMHLRPELVRLDKLRDDGLTEEPAVPGMVWNFDEITEMGSFGEATKATPEKGKILFEAAVTKTTANLHALYQGIRLQEV
jgi:creatinine amidohydrolase